MAKVAKRGGQYRQMLLERQGAAAGEEAPVSFFRIKFYICLCLFVGYLILDYTKASVYDFDSSRVYAEISRDMTEELNLKETLARVLDSVWVSEEEPPE